MLITCPKCDTTYDIDASLIPDSGKNVRCAKCSQVFFVSPPISLEAENDKNAPQPFIDMPGVDEEPPYRQAPLPPEDESYDASSLEDETSASFLSDAADEAFSLPPDVVDPPPPEEIIGMIPSLPPLHQRTPPTQRSKPQKKKSKHPFFWLLVFFNLILLGVVLWTGRFYFAVKFPQVKPFYEMLGVSFEYPGFGLEFRKVKKDYSKPGFLLLSGDVVNDSSKAVKVPYMKISFYNDKRVLLHSLSVAPIREALSPGEIMPFTVEIQSPPVAAFEVELTFMR